MESRENDSVLYQTFKRLKSYLAVVGIIRVFSETESRVCVGFHQKKFCQKSCRMKFGWPKVDCLNDYSWYYIGGTKNCVKPFIFGLISHFFWQKKAKIWQKGTNICLNGPYWAKIIFFAFYIHVDSCAFRHKKSGQDLVGSGHSQVIVTS